MFLAVDHSNVQVGRVPKGEFVNRARSIGVTGRQLLVVLIDVEQLRFIDKEFHYLLFLGEYNILFT